VEFFEFHINLNLDGKEIIKEEPCFEPSGILAEETNKVNGVVLKFTEPLDADQPDKKWRLYWFKGDEEFPALYIHRQSWFLIGKDMRVWDIHLEHESISGQHAVIQFRQYKFMDEEGNFITEVRPYIIDLESTNGTKLNDQAIEGARYYELRSKDILNFGYSTRDYILMDGGPLDENLEEN
jgi:smad nuclear-interacting protein 1